MSGHHRSLPLYCVIGADALSRAGNAMTTIAIPLIVLNQGYSAAEVGLSSAAASLPIVIGALAGGSFADRIGYRTTSVISDAASGVTVLVLGLLAQLHMLPLWALLALVFLSNLMDVPGSGARASQIPDLTRLAGAPLTRSTGIRSTLGRLATMLRSAAAGVVVSLTSPDVALYINAVCFLISSAVTILMVPSDAALRQEGVRDTIAPVSDGMSLRDFFAGAAFIVHTPLVRAIVIMVVLTNLLDSAAMNVLWALYGRADSVPPSPGGHRHSGVVCRFHQPDDRHHSLRVDSRRYPRAHVGGNDRSGHRRHAVRQCDGRLSGPVHAATVGIRHHRRLLCRRFVLTGFGRHWRRFDESFRHATEV